MRTRKNETGKPAAPAAIATRDELTDGALEKVSGGSITRTVDKSSTKLFQACATGEHIKST
jgi:type VI protein secretion system component Hcp